MIDNVKDKVKQKWEENPVDVITAGCSVAMAAVTVVFGYYSIQEIRDRRKYIKIVNRIASHN